MAEVLSEKKSGKSKASKKSKKPGKEDENKVENSIAENKEANVNLSSNAPEQVISTRAYLEQNVTGVIQEAMLEVARKRPPNPLEFVGNYILDRAHGK